MDLEKYKTILSCYRPEVDSAHDPAIQEALAALESSSELSEWFASEQAFDHSFKASLEDFAPPPVEELLAPARQRKRWPKILAVAAMLFLMGGLGFLGYTRSYNQKTNDFTDFREAMAYFSAGGFFMLDKLDDDLPSLQAFMQEKGGAIGDDLTDAFATATPMGCRIVEWQEHEVTLYCFVNDHDQIIHAYLAPLELLTEEARHSIQEIRTHSELQTAGWVDDGTVYLLVGAEPEVKIQPYLMSCLHPTRMALLFFQ